MILPLHGFNTTHHNTHPPLCCPPNQASEFHGGLTPEERDSFFAEFIQGRRNVRAYALSCLVLMVFVIQGRRNVRLGGGGGGVCLFPSLFPVLIGYNSPPPHNTPPPQVLVATDLLSRGIDVEGIAWVINFDMPFLPRVARSDDEGNMTDTGVRACVCCTSVLWPVCALINQPQP